MDKTYQFKDLIEIIPFVPKALSRMPKWDVYGDGLIEYVADRGGVWLYKHGSGFDDRGDRKLTWLSRSELSERRIEGFGIVYGMKDGTPLLPLPFTAKEFMTFNARTAGMITRVNQHGERTGKWIEAIRKRNNDATDLAAVILYGDLPMPPEVSAPIESASAPSAATLVAVVPTENHEAIKTRSLWRLKEPGNLPRYGKAVYEYLKSEFEKGKDRRPRASDLVDKWGRNPVHPIISVDDGLVSYEDRNGIVVQISNTPARTLDAIRRVIARMTAT